MELKTALYDCHVAAGGKIVPFAGYLLPVQYPSGVVAEHMAVRQQAGLFDVSHMGEVVFKGPDAFANIQHLLTNDFTSLTDGGVRYSPMCYDNGGVVDDLLVYRKAADEYFVVVNASNRHKDVAWIQEHLFGDVQFSDISDDLSELALQGPNSEAILQKLTHDSLPEGYYTFVPQITVAGVSCLVSRTGYTGEDGFELYCQNSDAVTLWNALLEAGMDLGLIPCGLGARDTLRLEAGMPLYGHEMDENIMPRETGLGLFVKLTKDDFIGKQAMVDLGDPQRCRVGLEITGKGIAREHCKVYRGEEEIGWVTSGTHCPYLGKAVAMAIIPKEAKEIGAELLVDVRGRKISAQICKLPFYKRAK